jgi:hypothetical protein
MAYLKIAIDAESLRQLTDLAVRERRPVMFQAEVLLLTALGRWPLPDHSRPEDHPNA